MGLFDFLSGSSQDPSQQGLPPQHSSVARLLELAGGLTGLTPLAAAGYLADQGTVSKFNEAYWPKFKSTLAQAGVPQQRIDMLEQMPIAQRTAAANELYQAALSEKPKEQALVPEYNVKTHQERYMRPQEGQDLGPDWVTSSFLKAADQQPQKPGSVESSFQQAWLVQHPGDYAGAANYAANAVAKIKAKYERQPQVNITMPESLVYGTMPNGSPAVLGVEHPKGGGTPTVTPAVPFPAGFVPSRGNGGPSAKGKNESQWDYFKRTYTAANPTAGPEQVIGAYHAAQRESEDQKLKTFAMKLSLTSQAIAARGDAAETRKFQELTNEIAAGYKLSPETREQKYQDWSKRLGDMETSANRRNDHATANRIKTLRQEMDEGLRARPGAAGSKAAVKAGRANEDFQGYKYATTMSVSDPTTGIGRLNQHQGFVSRATFGHMPQMIWIVNGEKVNPRTLTADQIVKYAGILKDAGFTIDQIYGPGGAP